MDEQTKKNNIEILEDVIREAQRAITNIEEDDVDDVQQNFIQIESIVQDLAI